MRTKVKLSTVVIALFIIFFVCVTALCIYTQEEEYINTFRFIVSASDTSEEVSLFYNNGIYYAFLPSYTDIDNLEIEHESGCYIYIDGNLLDDSFDITSLINDEKEHNITIKNAFKMTVSNEKLIIMKSENIPTLSIRLVDGTIDDINADKNTEKSGTCTLIKEDRSINYQGSFKSLHGRGNSTWDQKKKPYALEFFDDVNILGMGASQNWVLLSNSGEDSSLRNKIVYDAAKKLGLQYSVDSEFVDLYIDGTYYGLYLLSEKVEIANERIDINRLEDETSKVNNVDLKYYDLFRKNEPCLRKGYSIPGNPDDITGGYLFEVEISGREKDENNIFSTKRDNLFSVKYPKHCSEKQIDYIADVSQMIEDCLSSDKLSEYIDMTSWEKYYLIQEVFGNMDVTSFFFYKDSDKNDGKVYAGPIWDFDSSLGNHHFGSIVNSKALYVSTWGWFKEIYDNESFRSSIKRIYKNELKDIVDDILNHRIDEYGELIEASYEMNKARWDKIQYYDRCDHFDTLDEHIESIRRYLSERQDFCDEIWLDSKEGFNICFEYHNDYTIRYYYFAECGKKLDDMPPEPYIEGYKFTGWYNKETNRFFDEKETITEDAYLRAEFESIDNKTEADNVAEIKIADKLKIWIISNTTLTILLIMFSLMGSFVAINIFKDLGDIIKKRSRKSNDK